MGKHNSAATKAGDEVAATSCNIADRGVHGVLAGCRPPVPVSKYNACHIDPSTNKYTITCEHAVCVNVRASLHSMFLFSYMHDVSIQ